jgi:beta-mannosidase
MDKFLLNGIWTLTGNGYNVEGEIPGSLYSFLLNKGLMENPHYRTNALDAVKIANNEYTFTKKFNYVKQSKSVKLILEGVDTLSTVYLNGNEIGKTENMHVSY